MGTRDFALRHAVILPIAVTLLAPELASGESELTAASDVFTLGWLLYQLLTLKPATPQLDLSGLSVRMSKASL